MAASASKSVTMITQLHRIETGTIGTSDVRHDVATSVNPDECLISEQERQSGRRLRTLLLIGNAIAWIVIIFAARALFF
jgi:hypothetical protein